MWNVIYKKFLKLELTKSSFFEKLEKQELYWFAVKSSIWTVLSLF